MQFFNIFFILSLDKNFRSKFCYFLFTDINDLPECLKYATARMFADDTNITNSHKSTARFHREVNHDLNNLRNWPLANQLSLNVLKTEYMYFASDYNLSNLGIFEINSLKIDEQTITRIQSTKSLGVVFDQRVGGACRQPLQTCLIRTNCVKTASSGCSQRHAFNNI